jgi:hypothetical protein
MDNWQNLKIYRAILIMRTQYTDRDRMSDDWIAKSIPYSIDAQYLTLVTNAVNQMRATPGMTNPIEFNFVVLPKDITPDQIRTLRDVAVLGGKILYVVGEGVPMLPASPVNAPPTPNHPSQP